MAFTISRKNLSLRLAQNFKKAGGTRERYVQIKTDAINKAAKEEGWRDSERAMMLADVQQTATKVWKQS